MEMFIVSSGAVQVSICAFVILMLSFVLGQGGGWTQWQHHLCDSWTRGLFWGDRPPGHWRHEQENSQHQGEYSDAKFVLRFLVLTFCRRTASQLCLFSSSGISKPQWRTIQRTRLCSRGCKSFFVGNNSLIWQNFLAKTSTVFKSSWLRNNLSKESSEGEERGGGQASGRETQETSTRGGGIREGVNWKKNVFFRALPE